MTPDEAMAKYGITVEARFIPFSKSRNAKPNAKLSDRSLNWIVSIFANGRHVLTTDYQAGIGHCPSYRQNQRPTLEYADKITHETETGKAWKNSWSSGAAILPKPEDVIHCLVMDSEAINCGSFEDWATEYGYDVDSRQAESIYRACLDTGLKLRAGFGNDTLERMREVFQDY